MNSQVKIQSSMSIVKDFPQLTVNDTLLIFMPQKAHR